MKKRFHLSIADNFFSRLGLRSSMGVILLILVVTGCHKNMYTPPDKEAKSEIIVINDIYKPGFYVELDGQEVGYLKQEMEIKVKPGEHKLKVFNKETSLALTDEKQETHTHTFELKVKVGEEEVKKIVLSWDDKGYSKDVKRGVSSLKGKNKEEGNKRGNPSQSPF